MKFSLKRMFAKKKFKFDMTGVKKKVRKITWKKVLIWLGFAILGLILLTAIAFAWFSKDLPTPSKIANRKPTVSTKIYDRTGQILLYETGEQRRTIVTNDQISPYLKDATISIEDTNFYNHHGVEPRAIVSAVVSKLLGKTNTLRGGSTITQQYVKNALLTSDRSIVRKIKEAILSVELEFMFSKDEILTMYLNEIPYGNATAGAEAAARSYYGIPAKDLTLAQAATLAGIPKAPTYYSPYGTHVDKLVIRKNYVLDMMVKNGKITQEQADEAKNTDTTTVGTAMKARHDSILAPHFAMYVMEEVANEYGEEKIQKEGLNIITTLDYDKQKAAEESITAGATKLAKYGGSNAALVAVDPKTGQILTMVGSKDYFDTSIDGNVNVADSLRQPGSSFKPFAYATAFKKPEYSPSKVIYDFETNFGGTPPYIPHNYNNRSNGPVTIRQSLSNSLNIPAVKIMALAGLDNVIRTAQDMGITTLNQRDRYGLSLVLGSGEVKPVEMAGAFSVFANNGVKHDLSAILKISDSKNKVLYEYDEKKNAGKEVLDPQIAYEISSILSDNNARALVFGTRTQLYFPNRTVAVKTGTTSDFKDAWTVGYTPSLAVAVWTGNSNAKAMSSGADGSVVAAPIFHSFLEKALANVPNEDFTRPEGIQEATVERYSNKLPGPYSTETTTDIFASWQLPKETDDLHKIIKVCKGTNLLAPDDASADLIEEKVFTDLHSEMPNNPNWEDPVRRWATEKGMTATIPTEKCDVTSVAPTVSIVNPVNNESVSGSTNISVDTKSSSPIVAVTYYLDDVSIGENSTSPYGINYNFDVIDSGSHTLSAVVTDDKGMTGKSSIKINISDQSVSISDLTYQLSSSKPFSATITWKTNVSADSKITYSADGVAEKSESVATLSTNHAITITNLTAGKNYSFIVTSKSDPANSASKAGTFATPLSSEENGPQL